MQILYEEDGDFRVGAVLSQSPNSYQVETQHGRRAKVKAGNVLMQFEQPEGAELLLRAQQFADALSYNFV